jgi:hypothetical protein
MEQMKVVRGDARVAVAGLEFDVLLLQGQDPHAPRVSGRHVHIIIDLSDSCAAAEYLSRVDALLWAVVARRRPDDAFSLWLLGRDAPLVSRRPIAECTRMFARLEAHVADAARRGSKLLPTWTAVQRAVSAARHRGEEMSPVLMITDGEIWDLDAVTQAADGVPIGVALVGETQAPAGFWNGSRCWRMGDDVAQTAALTELLDRRAPTDGAIAAELEFAANLDLVLAADVLKPALPRVLELTGRSVQVPLQAGALRFRTVCVGRNGPPELTVRLHFARTSGPAPQRLEPENGAAMDETLRDWVARELERRFRIAWDWDQDAISALAAHRYGGAERPARKIACPSCGIRQTLSLQCSRCAHDNQQILLHRRLLRKDEGRLRDAAGLLIPLSLGSPPVPFEAEPLLVRESQVLAGGALLRLTPAGWHLTAGEPLTLDGETVIETVLVGQYRFIASGTRHYLFVDLRR